MSSVYVGNDIVDLANPRTKGRAADERFVGRVLDAGEQAVIRASAEPDLELWCHWAAKEAGFKVISKLVGEPPPFVHRTFRVAWSEEDEAGSGSGGPQRASERADLVRRGSVGWREHRAQVSVVLHREAVHAVAYGSREATDRPPCVRPRVARLDAAGSAWTGSLDELMQLFSSREADAVYSLPSAAVRLGARRELADLLGVPEGRLEIVCAPGPTSQRPPRVLLDGRETEADVSLSHDGPLIAWAVWVGIDSEAPFADSTPYFDAESRL